MSRYHESYNEPEWEDVFDDDFEYEYQEQLDYARMDMGYLEDDLELYGEYDDDFSSVWR